SGPPDRNAASLLLAPRGTGFLAAASRRGMRAEQRGQRRTGPATSARPPYARAAPRRRLRAIPRRALASCQGESARTVRTDLQWLADDPGDKPSRPHLLTRRGSARCDRGLSQDRLPV